MSFATCRTEGCGNADQPIDVGNLAVWDDDKGEWAPPMTVMCGVCGQQIVDVTDEPPPTPEPDP